MPITAQRKLVKVIDDHMKNHGELVPSIRLIARACPAEHVLAAVLAVIGDAACNRHRIQSCRVHRAWETAAQVIGLRCDMSDRRIHDAIMDCIAIRDHAPLSVMRLCIDLRERATTTSNN